MAGLIPQSFIQDLIARTDIVQVIGERLQLKKAGREYVALSPFTNEKSPSFYVSPQKQFYHCFSSGKHGTAITFLMEYDRLSFPEAVEDLAKRVGLTVPREGGSVAAPLVLEGPLDALAAAERIYKAELKKSPAAIEYLKQRGVSGETAKRFGIGFAPDGWDTISRQVPNPKHALDAGLLVKNEEGRVYDFYRARVMFPVRNVRGQIITFGGRVLPGSDDKRKYLNGRETPLFDKSRHLYGLYEARQGVGTIPHMLVVEGYMDVVMLSQHGIPHAVATMGTATTREHLNLLFKSTTRVVFCFDGDRAGRAAAWRALEQALPEAYEGRELLFMFLPDGHDPDTLVQEIGAEEFNRRVAQSQSLATFLVAELSRQVNLSTPDGRARLVVLARPHLARMREGALHSLILEELFKLTRMQRSDIEALVSAATSATPAGDAAAAQSLTSRPVRVALQLLLEHPSFNELVDDIGLLEESAAPGVELLVAALRWFRDRPEARAGALLEAWRETPEGPILDQLSIAPLELKPEAFEAEFTSKIKTLEEMATQRSLRERVQTILQAAETRALTAEERAEVDHINRKLSRRDSV
ncbi:MAG TPA: DNA primase [Verrucomicrobiae bacterium]|nr:DNA primase [Verrucomicrobiae bacterium]